MQFLSTYQERQQWKSLQDSAARGRFYVEFWGRRDPKPETPQNEALDEHRRRVAYAEERFQGWRSARGRVYLVQGPPSEIESHPDRLEETWRYQDGREYEFSGERYELERMRVNGSDYRRVAPMK
jgi:GWxTD domain-containing protein